MKRYNPKTHFFSVSIVLLLVLGLSVTHSNAAEVDAGEDQVVAMHDVTDPNGLVDPNLLDPTHPAWPMAFSTNPNSPIGPKPVVVKLNGSHTADPNTPVTIAWSVTDANQAVHVLIDDAGVLDPNVTFNEPNLYSLTLAVDDGISTETDTVYIKVKLAGNALQGHWKFDGDPNDPNDYDWNYTTYAGNPDFGPGVVGDAIILKQGDSVSYGNVIGAETSISVAFWMNPASDFAEDKSQGIVRKYSGTSSDPQGGWTFQLRSETELRWRCSSGWDGGAGDLKVVDSFPVDTWTHVVGTYNGQTSVMKFYMNGQLVAERNSTDTCFDWFIDELTIGSSNFSGMIDDLYVFDYPLNTDEIRPLVAKGLNVAPAVKMQTDQVKIIQPVSEVNLSGTVVEEGAYTAQWTVVDKPIGTEVQILSPDALITTVLLDTEGNYRLRLTVTDQGTPPMSDSADVVVKVRPSDFDGLEAHFTFTNQTANSNLPTSVPYMGELFGDPGWTEGRGGEGDYSILLDGIDDHINFDSYLGSDPCCTIALWVGNDAIENDSHIIQKWASDSSGKGWMIRNRVEENPGQIAIMIGSGFSGAGAYSVTEAFIPPVQWTHIALTFDGSLVNLYLNGTQVFSDIVDNENFSAGDLVTPMVIGYRWNNESRFFKGAIDEVRIYDYALTAEAIEALYKAEGGE
ncbi:MAG: LamG-like jellyroll fold domain-containing protein [Planctomycetota bacterium]